MPHSSSRAAIVALFLLALAFHLAIVGADFVTLAKNGFLYDDSFYAFKIAENIAGGHGVTFDGVHPTNGFQPLYILILVPVFWLFGASLTAPVHVALALSAIFTAVTAVLLFRICRRYAGERVSLAVALLWVFSPVVTRQAANGLETALALMCFSGVVYYYITRVRISDRPSRRHVVTLGVLMGLAVLSRVDEIFLALVIALDYLVLHRRSQSPRRVAGNVGWGFLSASLVYSPWLLFSYHTVGRFFQESGTATRFLSMAYAPFFGVGSEDILANGPNLAFVWGHVTRAVSIFKVTPPVHVFFRAMEKGGAFLGVSPVVAVLANVLGIVAAVGLIVVICRKRRDGACRIRELDFLPVFAVVLIAAYAFYIFGLFFFTRYFYPIYFIACIYTAFVLEIIVGAVRRRLPGIQRLAVAAMACYLVAFGYMAYSAGFRSRPVYFFYDVAKWVSTHTAPHETIGVFQGGAVGYLADRKVVNLDGKVNGEALAALREHRLPEYLRQEGIDVVLDNSRVLEMFLGSTKTHELAVVGYDEIMRNTSDRIPGWSAYRIHARWQDSLGSHYDPSSVVSHHD